jgi:hypothetical protein
MSDLSQKRRKGGGAFAIPIRGEKDSINYLQYWAGNGKTSHYVDLSLYEYGIKKSEIENDIYRWKRKDAIPFTGRPLLIRELAPHLYTQCINSSKAVVKTYLSRLSGLWRMLDRLNSIAPVQSVRDFNEIHYASYRLDPCISGFSFLFQLVDAARADLDLKPLHWAAIRIKPKEKNLPDISDVKRIYEWLKRPAFAALERFRIDPASVPTKHEVAVLYTLFVLNTGWNGQVAFDIDVSECNESGIPKCIFPHPQSPSHSIIVSNKARAGNSLQSASSNNKRQLSPHNIVLALLNQTIGLRSRLRDNLLFLVGQLDNELLSSEMRQVYKLQKERCELILASPWIYQLRLRNRRNGFVKSEENKNNLTADISFLSVAGNVKYNAPGNARESVPILKFAAAQINKALKSEQRRIAEDITLSDLRDAFISWRYQSSGYSWIDAMLAAGHGNVESLRAYLQKKQHKMFSQKEMVRVTDQLWSSVVNLSRFPKEITLPTVVAAKVAGASEAQLSRWQEGEDRTYVGAGCSNITNPPIRLAPNHKRGTICRVQRCTLCPENAVLFSDSYIHLAMRFAELRYMRQVLSIQTWSNSDFDDEMSMTEAALKLYDADTVDRTIKDWEHKILEGSHVPMMTESRHE